MGCNKNRVFQHFRPKKTIPFVRVDQNFHNFSIQPFNKISLAIFCQVYSHKTENYWIEKLFRKLMEYKWGIRAQYYLNFLRDFFRVFKDLNELHLMIFLQDISADEAGQMHTLFTILIDRVPEIVRDCTGCKGEEFVRVPLRG